MRPAARPASRFLRSATIPGSACRRPAACASCARRKCRKLQTACTTTVAEGQVFITESPEIAQARKATIELLLGNHPLDCPVCDAGGECELQDMTFKYGAGESLYAEAKQHREEQQWSPAVFFDRPRCILCYRCVRMCGEGMDVWALGIQNRGVSSVIAPNEGDHLDCEQCGMCIDVCPVGALTSGSYRYKTRPWEMNHVSTVCTHCGDGCKVTLGVRQSNDGSEIVRADNRDKSGINGDFLCAKGRFGFDFVESPERLTTPLVRNAAGQARARHLGTCAALGRQQSSRKFATARAATPSASSAPTAPPTKRTTCCRNSRAPFSSTNNIDHERTTDYAAFARALAGHQGKAASLRDIASAPAILLIGGDPTDEHPLLAWNTAHQRAPESRPPLHRELKADQAGAAGQGRSGLAAGGYRDLAAYPRRQRRSTRLPRRQCWPRNRCSSSSARSVAAAAVAELVAWGLKRGNVRFAYLGDHANSRGAADMGLFPDLLPGYVPVTRSAAHSPRNTPDLPHTPGKTQPEMFAAAANGELGALLVVGANPVGEARRRSERHLKNTFVIVQDLFLTETPQLADVVFPAASLYEKTGTVTNTFGDVQLASKAADRAGVKPDFEILVRLADAHGRRRQDARALRQGRRDGRSWPVARRAVRRGRSARCLACSQRPRTEAEPLRSARRARRD